MAIKKQIFLTEHEPFSVQTVALLRMLLNLSFGWKYRICYLLCGHVHVATPVAVALTWEMFHMFLVVSHSYS